MLLGSRAVHAAALNSHHLAGKAVAGLDHGEVVTYSAGAPVRSRLCRTEWQATGSLTCWIGIGWQQGQQPCQVAVGRTASGCDQVPLVGLHWNAVRESGCGAGLSAPGWPLTLAIQLCVAGSGV